SLIKTYLSYAFTGLVLNNVFSYILVDILNVSKLIAPLINMILGMPINFLINKLWAFNSK
ncbi:MAG: GtrA family protein, partial [Lachnoanaerobaculum sp.]|nr:GtrA family protein [Lachnoanaerobaculum sp.]